jgi:hypothetical protein
MSIHEYVRFNEATKDSVSEIIGRGLSTSGTKQLEPKYYGELSSWTISYKGATFVRSLVPSQSKKIRALQDKKIEESQVSELVEVLLKNSLHFFSESELSHFKVNIVNNQLFTSTTLFSKWCIGSETGNHSGEMRFQEYIQQNEGVEVLPTPIPTGDYMYVLKYTKEFYVFKERRGEIQHISITLGEAVLGAGEIKIKDERIVEINNLSGHYRPTRLQLMNVLEYLASFGVDVDSFNTICRDSDSSFKSQYIKPIKEHHNEIAAGCANLWIQEQKEVFEQKKVLMAQEIS